MVYWGHELIPNLKKEKNWTFSAWKLISNTNENAYKDCDFLGAKILVKTTKKFENLNTIIRYEETRKFLSRFCGISFFPNAHDKILQKEKCSLEVREKLECKTCQTIFVSDHCPYCSKKCDNFNA